MKDLFSARKRFKDDIFATETTGITIEDARENYAKCSLRTDERHRNAGGRVMGGAIFTLADFTFAVAANTEDTMTVSLTSDIRFLGTARGNTLTAEAKCLKSGRTTCAFDVLVTDETGTLIAVVSAVGLRLDR
ncbi:hypothetical protein SDC9_201790 [bioreactor metagenome]|uniref:Thioesterase domain-containing protein n=1 Tax=bioreactor metagenome TaxID=1076179 RepID=A0A645IRW1_9ZZZZ